MLFSRRRYGFCLLLCVVPAMAGAQATTGIAAVDSASVARAAWARASAAFGAHDLQSARREVEHAARAWPTQPAYIWARAVAAQLTNDTAAVLEALTAYAGLGLGKDLHTDSRFSGYGRSQRFTAIVVRHDSNRALVARSRVVARLGDSTFWPEGMDYDPRTGRYYVASVRHRTIAEVVNGVATRELWPRDEPGIGAVLGVRIDTKRGVLWATLNGMLQMHGFSRGDSIVAALVRVRLTDGAIERRWDLSPSPLGHVLGDLAIGPLGDVFMTDSNEPVLYRLRPGSDTLERITNPLFRSLQGIASAPNGHVAYVADYAHGLLRVDLDGGAVARLDDAPGSTSLGCDGIAWDRGAIVAVQNGVSPARIMRFVLDSEGRRIVRAELLDRNFEVADEPTIGAIVGSEFVYVANSQWEKYTEDGRRKPELRLATPVLLAVPLPENPRQ